nr:hypothetical protein [Xanthomonas translucens]
MELVAGGLLDQARVHAAPFDRLEHLPPARLRHWYRVAHLPVDVQCEAADLLAIAQRERQLPFQHPRIGVEEQQIHRGFGQTGRGVCAHRRRAQFDRALALIGLQQWGEELPLRRGLRPRGYGDGRG